MRTGKKKVTEPEPIPPEKLYTQKVKVTDLDGNAIDDANTDVVASWTDEGGVHRSVILTSEGEGVFVGDIEKSVEVTISLQYKSLDSDTSYTYKVTNLTVTNFMSMDIDPTPETAPLWVVEDVALCTLTKTVYSGSVPSVSNGLMVTYTLSDNGIEDMVSVPAYQGYDDKVYLYSGKTYTVATNNTDYSVTPSSVSIKDPKEDSTVQDISISLTRGTVSTYFHVYDGNGDEITDSSLILKYRIGNADGMEGAVYVDGLGYEAEFSNDAVITQINLRSNDFSIQYVPHGELTPISIPYGTQSVDIQLYLKLKITVTASGDVPLIPGIANVRMSSEISGVEDVSILGITKYSSFDNYSETVFLFAGETYQLTPLNNYSVDPTYYTVPSEAGSYTLNVDITEEEVETKLVDIYFVNEDNEALTSEEMAGVEFLAINGGSTKALTHVEGNHWQIGVTDPGSLQIIPGSGIVCYYTSSDKLVMQQGEDGWNGIGSPLLVNFESLSDVQDEYTFTVCRMVHCSVSVSGFTEFKTLYYRGTQGDRDVTLSVKTIPADGTIECLLRAGVTYIHATESTKDATSTLNFTVPYSPSPTDSVDITFVAK